MADCMHISQEPREKSQELRTRNQAGMRGRRQKVDLRSEASVLHCRLSAPETSAPHELLHIFATLLFCGKSEAANKTRFLKRNPCSWAALRADRTLFFLQLLSSMRSLRVWEALFIKHVRNAKHATRRSFHALYTSAAYFASLTDYSHFFREERVHPETPDLLVFAWQTFTS